MTMELSVIGKTIAAPSVQGMCLLVQPHGAVAPARVCCKSRTIRRNRRRTRRRLFSGDDYEDGAEDPLYYSVVELGSTENFWYYVDPAGGGPSDGGRFGFNGGKGGGGGWNSGGFGGQSSEDPSPPPPPPEWSSGFATNPLHEFIWWVALSNCLLFVLKKIMTMAAEAIGKAKLPIGL